MSGRQVDNGNGPRYQNTNPGNQATGSNPSRYTSRQIQAYNRRAAYEVEQITRALANNAPPNSITYNVININHRYTK